MSTTPTTPQSPKDPVLVLQLLLSILGTTAGAIGAASGPTPVGAGAAVAASLIEIAQKAIAAHEAQTGQPIDPALLRPFEPLLDPAPPTEEVQP